MALGQRIRQARLEAGLSQRQLCGGEITRNMLSQIENGSAKPSMSTLQFLAARLGKPVAFFLEEQAITSPNQAVMTSARNAFAGGDIPAAMDALESYRAPDPVFDAEQGLLLALCRMALAESAIKEQRLPYAARLLQQIADDSRNCPYYSDTLERKHLLLLAKTGQERPTVIAAGLPSMDEELLVRAEAALQQKAPERCIRLLDAAEDTGSPRWALLRGDACFARKDYAAAAEHYRRAEDSYPKQTLPRLETCYRELGDYKLAYEYACKQR